MGALNGITSASYIPEADMCYWSFFSETGVMYQVWLGDSDIDTRYLRGPISEKDDSPYNISEFVVSGSELWDRFLPHEKNIIAVVLKRLRGMYCDRHDIFDDEKSEEWSKTSAPVHPQLQMLVSHPNLVEGNRIACSGGPGFKNVPLRDMIIHLNDSHRWTWNQIADWLDTLNEQPIFYPRFDSGAKEGSVPNSNTPKSFRSFAKLGTITPLVPQKAK